MSVVISRHERFVFPVLAAMIGAAWVALASFPDLHFGHQFGLSGDGHAGHGAPDRMVLGLRPLMFVGSWVLMTTAMMMPATLPLIDIFRRLTQARADRLVLISLLVVGYLVAWSGLGVVTFFGMESIRAWLPPTGLVAGVSIGAILFLVAGAYQFMPFKDRCLTQCRAPRGFVIQRWNGQQPRRAALRTGVEHGAFCVGCCWALMLLMFAFNVASIVWMLVLGVVMGIEKNARCGRRIVKPVGYALLSTGLGLVILSGQATG